MNDPLCLIGNQGTAIWRGNEIVASVGNARTNHKKARADAEFIVLACNSHDDLANALKDARQLLTIFIGDDVRFLNELHQKMLKNIDAVLAKS